MLTKEEIEALTKFHRYLDKDDDGIPYRTLPGVSAKGAYFTRGSGHNQYGAYTEDSTEYQVVLDRLVRKFKRAKTLVPPPVIEATGTSDIGLVAIGSSRGAVNEARDILAKRGIPIDYMRIKAFPFTREVESFMASHERIFVVEQNRDAQLRSLLTLETDVPKSKLHSILHYNGLPMTSKEIVEAVLGELGEGRRAAASA
jgi:2-oxoglutarate ferredoxin oxidoreductase subunit alpha